MRRWVLPTAFCCLAAFAAGVVFLFFTPAGSNLAARLLIKRYFESDDVRVERIEGILARQVRFHNVRARQLRWAPPGTVCRIQQIDVSVSFFRLLDTRVQVHNGRLLLRGSSHPIVFFGAYRNGRLRMNVYSKSVGAQDLFDLTNGSSLFKYITGSVKDFDAYVTGTWRNPEFQGSFLLESFGYKDFSMYQAPVRFRLRMRGTGRSTRLRGTVVLQKGSIVVRQTTIHLEKGTLTYAGNPKEPRLDVRGVADVEGVTVRILLLGTKSRPDLRLRSEPVLPQQALLLMLATGRRWRGAEGGFAEGHIPIDLARDFVDYFVFSRIGGLSARRFGVSDISLSYDPKTGGFGLRKPLPLKTEVTYGVEQREQTFEQQRSTTHSLGAEYKINRDSSIGVERRIRLKAEEEELGQTEDEPPLDSSLLLKYKRKF